MARFWAVPVFSNKIWTVWSACETADYQHGLVDHRPNLQTQKPSWQWRNISLLTFLAGWTKEQVLDKGIRQKSTKRVGSIVVCSAFCPGSDKRDPLDSKKMACLPELRVQISRIMPQNVYTRPFYSWEMFCTPSDAKWLMKRSPDNQNKRLLSLTFRE